MITPLGNWAASGQPRHIALYTRVCRVSSRCSVAHYVTSAKRSEGTNLSQKIFTVIHQQLGLPVKCCTIYCKRLLRLTMAYCICSTQLSRRFWLSDLIKVVWWFWDLNKRPSNLWHKAFTTEPHLKLHNRLTLIQCGRLAEIIQCYKQLNRWALLAYVFFYVTLRYYNILP